MLVVSGVHGTFIGPSPVGAAETDVITVWVHPTRFQGPDPAAPSRIYAEPEQEIVFKLVDPADRHHTVTIVPADCNGQPRALCDKSFDDPFVNYSDPGNPTVKYRWSREGEYRFYDRYAWEESRREMTGVFIVTHSPATVQPLPAPSPTSTTVPSAPPTTTTTAPTTTTAAPTPIRPQLAPGPPSTTTTAAASNPPPTPKAATPPPPASPKKGNRDRNTGNGKAKPPETSATTAPLPPDTAWIDSLLDPGSLTPGPELPAGQPAGHPGDDAALDAVRAAGLLEKPTSEDGDDRLLLIALAAVATVLVSGVGWAWCTRASRYNPA